MRILQVAEAVHPSFGGIAEGIFQQGIELRKLGHHVDVLSGESEPVQRLCEEGGLHHAFHPTRPKWRWSKELRSWLIHNIANYDIVVLNGLWMGPIYEAGRAARRAGIPYVVMPHGMLDPYFLKSYKQRSVKRGYWALLEGSTIKGAKGLFFTAQAEEEKARSSYPLSGIKAWQVGYGIRDPERAPVESRRQDPGTQLLFMSRIHPKKGLDIAIEAVRDSSEEVSLDVCGDGDSQYFVDLKMLAAPLGSRVRWHGFTSGEEKWRRIEQCDAMILTSHQENFGVIVAEAMSVARPVLISREVNIWREIVEDKAGLVCDDNVDSAKQMIEAFRRLSQEERLEMGLRARDSFLRRYTIQRSVASFEAALKEAAK